MTRSKWKGPYVKNQHLRIIINPTEKKSPINIISRNSTIIPKFIGLSFKVHNGKKYSEIKVINSMVNHKFGEFVQTRVDFSFKKKSK